MNGPYFIGVDGGGTRCRARLRDAAGRLLGEGLGGPANVHRDPAEAMRSVLSACRAATAEAGLDENVIGHMHAGLGLAGAGQPSAVGRFLAQPHPFASVNVETDAYAAWLGAFGGADGAILIVGTGSCGMAVVAGARTYVGGSGAEISDEGSGAAIGREALRRALWALDGRAPMTGLATQLLADFSANRETLVEWARRAGPSDFARLAPGIFDHARKADPLAAALVTDAAAEIARIGRRLLEIGAPFIALIGGLAESMRPWLPAELRRHLVLPAADAMDGAISIARHAHAALERSTRKRA